MRQIFSILAFVLFTFNLQASDSPYLIDVDIETKVMVVDFSKTSGKTVKITIQNLEEEEIFSEVVKKDAKSRRYNLKNLSTGTYTVIIDSEDKLSIQKVYVSQKSLLADENTIEIVKPTFHVNSKKWIVEGFNQDYPSYVTITDENGNEVFSEMIKNPKSVRSFDVQKLGAGSYTFSYTVKGKTFTHNIEIK